tara:strand:+ start:508 stop:609 length:102 start_codon:yes stop_codon:yes gene_type:complete
MKKNKIKSMTVSANANGMIGQNAGGSAEIATNV